MNRWNTVRSLVTRGLRVLAAKLQYLAGRADAWWQWHWTRVAEEHGYAEALIAVLTELVELLTPSLRLRYLAHELLAVYVPVLRSLRRGHPGDEPA